MKYPRLLVISNNSFSKSNSNGRTLGSLLLGWPKDCIAQFCISSDGADFDVCENYFCVTDRDVLHSTLNIRPSKRRDLTDGETIDANSRNGHVIHRKTTLKMFARNIAWEFGLWRGKEFNDWLRSVNPQIVLLQSGDSYFMINLAMDIAREFSSKLAVFNTEGFFFFKKDFFAKDSILGRQIFKLYRTVYRRSFSKFMKLCSKQIYGNVLLMEDYDREFDDDNSCVVYTGSSLSPASASPIREIPIFSYLGNLGFNRPDALIEFAQALLSIDPRYHIDVYGFAKNKDMENLLKNTPGICFHGAVSYAEVLKVIDNSDFLIHVESQCELWKESLRYGFSTKIADSISSGKIFILYSSPSIACAQYITRTKAGIFASTPEELTEVVTRVLSDKSFADSVRENARVTAEENHNIEVNAKKMQIYLIDEK